LRERKFIERGHAGTKRRGVVRACALARQIGDAARQAIFRRLHAAACCGVRSTGTAHHADDGTMPARRDEALVGEPFVGVEHRVARNAQLFGERSRSKKPAAVADIAIEDRTAQTLVEQILLRELAATHCALDVRHQQAVVQIRGSKFWSHCGTNNGATNFIS
jgi:hypothetical protein